MASQRRPGGWLPQVYYYLATAIGLAILLVGLIGGLHGLVTAALPQLSSEARYAAPVTAPDGSKSPATQEERNQARADALERARLGGLADAVYGGVTVLVGLPVFWWHLRQARRREPEPQGPEQSPTSPEPTG